MIIETISLKNYRNYDTLDLKFSSKLNIFLGENAQGKTNLLESIYVLSLARSHRTNNEREMIQWQKEFARIEGKIQRLNGSLDLTMIISNKGKKSKVNGLEQSKLSHYVGHLNVILFAPEDLFLVKGAPQNRRKFLDMEIGQINPQYLHNLSTYQNVLKQRNQYLKKMAFSQNKDLIYLDVLSEQLAKAGGFVLYHRLNFVKKLEVWANQIHQKITYQKENLKISYQSQLHFTDEMTEDELSELLLNALKEAMPKDLKHLTTSVGIHRDDLHFYVNERNVQNFGSQGQQRTTALSVKLAEIELINEEIGEYPILLLDDVLSELDDDRQVHLMEFIENKLQTFLTTTSLTHLDNKLSITPEIFNISEGMIEGDGE
ncbi:MULTISPECIES: DNA replication/repair protein RecF [Vagococcus]|uniref:DNA replication and repair protein RecF n=1 Tax=Vagococcus fluvialis bH819 TaxID=1255619 RepID=A0A1X6WRR1_9ENTE|nr:MULTISPECIES: DNA replication/repair protein RecF [Vagococcus]SLM86922.1 DNA recombination and repair protein RecF [Vagococcus fluvialis bH819]HCM88927.1 DNA replication/repair protein RecF [Vagococcus sp.]